MKLIDYIKPEFMQLNLESRDKKGVIEELCQPLAEYSGVNRDNLVKILLERERLGSTGIGSSIAIPHGKVKGLEHLMIGFGLSSKGVNFEAIDSKPVYLFFVIITPEDSTGDHLKVLAKISKILRDKEVRSSIIKSAEKEEILKIISDNDSND